jgi:DNA-directed RNA polymerase specialized sigma24 family protein
LQVPVPIRDQMQAASPHEVLAHDRRRYERLLLARLGGALSREDAEDIVSEALIRVQVRAADDPPKPGREEAWFARVVLNLGVDFLRARDGRRRNGVSPRPTVVPLTQIDEETHALAFGDEGASLQLRGALGKFGA